MGAKGKGRRTHLASFQAQALTPQARQFASMAAAMGFSHLLRDPKGQGKGQGNFATSQVAKGRTFAQAVSSGTAGGSTPVKEGGKAAMMVHASGKEVPIQWLCAGCHYPHHNCHMAKCINCKAKRDHPREPSIFIRSKVKIAITSTPHGPPVVTPQPVIAKPMVSYAKAKASPVSTANRFQSLAASSADPPLGSTPVRPHPGEAGTPKPAGEGVSSDAPACAEEDASDAKEEEDFDMTKDELPDQENPPTPSPPLYIPKCLSAHTVKLLLRQGVEAASKYRAHFAVKMAGPTELSSQLSAARQKLAGLESLDPAKFGSFVLELEIARADIATLEDKLGAAGEAESTSEHAPGVESAMLSKMTNILARHQRAMASEDEEHTLLIATLEEQAAAIQTQIAEEHRMHVVRTAANDELLVALKVRTDQLSPNPCGPRVAETTLEEAKQKLHVHLQQRFSNAWLGENGLEHMTEPALQAIIARYTETLRDAGPQVQDALLSNTNGPATIGERKRRAGEMERWANEGPEDASEVPVP